MKKLIFLLSLFLSFNVNADDDDWIDCGKDIRNNTPCFYKISPQGTLYVKANGSSTTTGHWQDSQANPTGPWYSQRNDITKIIIDDSVSQIGLRAFSQLKNVSTIILPENLTVVGAAAFQSCKGLSEIQLPSGLTTIESYAFATTGLTEISIPSSVTEIGEHAFAANSSLSGTVNLENVKTLGQYAFANCPKLQSIILGDDITSIGEDAFANTSAYIYCQEGEGHNGKSCAELVSNTGLKTGKLKIYTKEGNDIEGYLYKVGDDYFASMDLMVNNIKCDNKKQCESLLASAQNGIFSFNGKFYESLNDLAHHNYIKKRIYTIDEANQVAGDKNRISIRYR